MGATESLFEGLFKVYQSILGIFPESWTSFITLILAMILVVIVALFIWYFYKSLSQKDLITLNLYKYNRSEHPTISKILAVMLYFIEYILVMPFLILVWFTALAFIILVIADQQSVQGVLFLSAVLIGAIRILAYVHKEIAQDLAKLFPFITLSIFLLSPGAFNLEGVFLRAAGLGILFDQVFAFFFVIFVVEIILRLGSTVRSFWRSGEPGPV